MPWFYDTPYSAESGRHHLVFVNQQYDYLAGIAWDEEAGDYLLWGAADEQELKERLGYWSSVDGFSLADYLARARTELPALDRKHAEAERRRTDPG